MVDKIISDLEAAAPLAGDMLLPVENGVGTYAATVNQVKDYTLTSAEFLQSQKNKNAIINGDFNIWQRGTSFAAIATAAYFADRWQYNKAGTMVHTVSRSTDVPTVAEAGRLFNYSILADCTTIDSPLIAGDFTTLSQKIEGFNWLPLAQKAVTVSFWVKATKTGIYCVSLRNSGNDRSFVKEFTVNATNTWEKKSVTFDASPAAGNWNYENGIGANLTFCLAAGTTFHTTANAWQTGNFFATSNQVNATDSIANDFRITGVQLEQGSVATDFETRLIDNELSACQKYTLPLGSLGGSIVGINATNITIQIPFPVEMRAVPTATLLVTAVTIEDPLGGTNRTSTASTITAIQGSKTAYNVRINGFTGITASRAYLGADTFPLILFVSEL